MDKEHAVGSRCYDFKRIQGIFGKRGLAVVPGTDVDQNIGYESVQMEHKGGNEFLVAIGKQVYPEFMVFVERD